jgi:hypothetical protein
VLHAGRLSTEKNVDTILDAMPLMLKQKPELKLVVTSKGPAKKALEKKALKMGLQECVLFTGFVDDQDLVALYDQAELSIIASEADTQGLVIVEAMARGTPVIGADALAIPEVVDGNNGLLFQVKDAQDLAEKALTVLQDDVLKERMGENARLTAEKNTLEKRTDELLGLYERLTS